MNFTSYLERDVSAVNILPFCDSTKRGRRCLPGLRTPCTPRQSETSTKLRAGDLCDANLGSAGR